MKKPFAAPQRRVAQLLELRNFKVIVTSLLMLLSNFQTLSASRITYCVHFHSATSSHNRTVDYDRTLMHWDRLFTRSVISVTCSGKIVNNHKLMKTFNIIVNLYYIRKPAEDIWWSHTKYEVKDIVHLGLNLFGISFQILTTRPRSLKMLHI